MPDATNAPVMNVGNMNSDQDVASPEDAASSDDTTFKILIMIVIIIVIFTLLFCLKSVILRCFSRLNRAVMDMIEMFDAKDG